ncbi:MULTISPECIES: MerR family transcriptional regulator [Facklamia]|uniref:MerR family transcriptional regulator n=1 Tax=Facklamia hominis TaxID=178214 RepID=A0AAJ1V2D0_9LACT|nr:MULTISPECIES: MerR family transcriptional regulator [Facklamia]MDK7187370.1 MerR family transcriptional regulator [Facklamia hominis]OFL63784.1 hypothetical protein HMPREF2758_04175 [Facklamia sp. HMSC062C11]RYC98644.1 MerR family transcriptional regulator [Facklamia hominis]
MKDKVKRKLRPIFPIGTVMEITEMSARQVRYLEKYQLIQPQRSKTNRRLYSLNDLDRILDIKELMEEGMSLEGIKRRFEQEKINLKKDHQRPLTDDDVRRILYSEMQAQNRFLSDYEI